MSNEPSRRFWKNPGKKCVSAIKILLTATSVKEKKEIFILTGGESGRRLSLGRENCFKGRN